MRGDWISFIQVMAIFTSFGMGLFLGYVNFHNSGQSIAPSWVKRLHAAIDWETLSPRVL